MNQTIIGLLNKNEKKALADEGEREKVTKAISGLTKNQELSKAMLRNMDSHLKRRELSEFYISEINQRLNVDPIIIPYLYRDDFQLDAVKEIAAVIGPHINAG